MQTMPYGELASLLHEYIEIADRKDVSAVVELLGATVVRFPTDGYETEDGAMAFWERLWESDEQHRHDVSNIIVEPTDEAGTWRVRAHYSRWLFEPDPILGTLGEYDITAFADGTRWRMRTLTIHKTWVR